MKFLIALLFCGVAFAGNPPPMLTVPVGYDLTISWEPVTTYVNGTPLKGAPDYKLYSMNNPAVPGFLGYTGVGTSTKRVLNTPGIQCYAVSDAIWDPNSNESARSITVCVSVQGTGAPVPQAPATTTPVCVK